MRSFLSPDVQVAVRGEDLVLLDLRSGTYACLPGAARAMGLDNGRPCIDDPDLAALLGAEELLADTAPARPRSPPPSLPTRDLMTGSASRLSLAVSDRLALLRGLAAVTNIYRRGDFPALIAWARRRTPAQAAPTPSADIRRLALALRQLLPWIPFQGDCLYRSFLLRAVLRAAGQEAWWVFGVQTWPFEAHCWLQVGDTVLDDAAERVGAYTPILAV